MQCQKCNKEGATRNRQRTSYVNDEDNFASLCKECQKEEDEYWDERWKEYWKGVL